jgi:hypothetical protein
MLGHFDPGSQSQSAAGPGLAEECRGGVVLATSMRELPGDEYAAFTCSDSSQELDLKLAQ